MPERYQWEQPHYKPGSAYAIRGMFHGIFASTKLACNAWNKLQAELPLEQTPLRGVIYPVAPVVSNGNPESEIQYALLSTPYSGSGLPETHYVITTSSCKDLRGQRMTKKKSPSYHKESGIRKVGGTARVGRHFPQASQLRQYIMVAYGIVYFPTAGAFKDTECAVWKAYGIPYRFRTITVANEYIKLRLPYLRQFGCRVLPWKQVAKASREMVEVYSGRRKTADFRRPVVREDRPTYERVMEILELPATCSESFEFPADIVVTAETTAAKPQIIRGGPLPADIEVID